MFKIFLILNCHWKPRVEMMPNLSSLVTPQFVIMTTCRWTDRKKTHTDGRTDRQKDRQMPVWMEGWMDRQTWRVYRPKISKIPTVLYISIDFEITPAYIFWTHTYTPLLETQYFISVIRYKQCMYIFNNFKQTIDKTSVTLRKISDLGLTMPCLKLQSSQKQSTRKD